MTTTNQQALKPCPFCGTEPLESRIEPHKQHIAMMPDYPGAWCIECPKCEFQLFDHDSSENVAGAWNPSMKERPVLFSAPKVSLYTNQEKRASGRLARMLGLSSEQET
jgi:hypothetical protein